MLRHLVQTRFHNILVQDREVPSMVVFTFPFPWMSTLQASYHRTSECMQPSWISQMPIRKHAEG